MVTKSDYAVVGDLDEIVLAIVADVRARQSGRGLISQQARPRIGSCHPSFEG